MSPIHTTKKLFVSLLILFFAVGLFAGTIRMGEAASITVTRTFSCLTYDGFLYPFSIGDYNYMWSQLSADAMQNISTILHIGQGKELLWYAIKRAFVYFDTALIPDEATVTSAILSIYVTTDYSDIDFNVTIQSGQPTYPQIPLQLSDYYKGLYSGDGGNRSTSQITGAGYWNITMTNLSWINKEDITKLCLRSHREINGVAPTGIEYIEIYSAEQGSVYAPKLYVTFEMTGYHYVIHGPYYENGNVANCTANVTLQIANLPSENYFLNGTDGIADDVTIGVEQLGLVFTWNISSYNYTRVYYLTDAFFEEIWIFIPDPNVPFNLYTFTITDFAGVSDAYLESIINVNGQNRIVERQKLDVINAVPFYFVWAKRYDLHLTCNRGSYTWSFIALTETSQNLIITSDMFPTLYPGLIVYTKALRMNATWIQTNYTDNNLLTSWVKVDIQYKSGFAWLTAYSVNNTGNTHKIDWYSADSAKDYVVQVTALRNSELKTWSFSCPKPAASANPFEGLLDILGTFPFPAANLVGLFIVLSVFAVFSYAYLPVGCLLGVITAMVLRYIGWLQTSWALLGLAMVISIFVALSEAKKKEREI